MAILVEIIRVGNAQKVTAVDPVSGLEVSFVAPLTAGRMEIDRLARAKLAYVQRRKTAET